MKRRTALFVIALALVLAVASMFIWRTENAKPKEEIVTAAYVPAGFYAPILIADRLGYFRDEGLTLKLVRYNDNSLMISQFINGNLDLTAQSALTMFPIAEKYPDSFVYVYGQYAKSYFFVTTSSSPIKKISDIRGAKVGTWQSPTAVAYIQLLASKVGVQPAQYEVRRYGVTDVPSTLVNGTSDIIFTFDFPAQALVQTGKYRYVEPDALHELLGHGVPLFNGGAMISRALMKRDPAKAKAIQDALARSIGYIQGHPAEAKRILADILNVPLQSPGDVHLDTFVATDDEAKTAASSTYALMVKSGLAQGGLDVTSLFQ